MSTSYCLFSKELFQNTKNNLATFPCSPSQVEQVQWNLYGKIICLCNYNYNVYEWGFAKVKHKSEIASSFNFLLDHLKYDSVFKKFTFENLRSKPAWGLNKWGGNGYKALVKASHNILQNNLRHCILVVKPICCINLL